MDDADAAMHIAIASPDSVTVSIAALAIGTFKWMLPVKRLVTSTWLGTTVEWRGTRSTSSNIKRDREVGDQIDHSQLKN